MGSLRNEVLDKTECTFYYSNIQEHLFYFLVQMNPNANYEELQQRITQAYPGMSKQLQRIARYALERPEELALSTVAATAEATEVQPSAMIRFANALGYGGFSEMQQVFRGHLVERSSSYRDRIATLRRQEGNGSARGPAGVLHQIAADAMA